ncbi:MAG: 5'-nucleotidase C-terminal domain-containing protein [Paracoccaceae bacterium]
MNDKADTAEVFPRAGLRLLGTSDLHMHLRSFDYFRDEPDPSVGLTRVASLIRAARQEAGANACLLFDNGDGLQGTPMEEITPGAVHPLTQCFTALRYDAIGLGNHDFDFGLKALTSVIASVPCPVLCSNLHWDDPRQNLPVLQQVILPAQVECSDERTRPIQVGVFSVLPPQTLKWNGHELKGRAQIDDMADTAQRMIAELRADGADLVIAMAHTGLGTEERAQGGENLALALAKLPGITAVLAGHSHLPFPPENLHRDRAVPIVLPGFAGSHLGVIDLELAWSDNEGWNVKNAHAELRPIAQRDPGGHAQPLAPEDPDILQILKPPHDATRARMNTVIGQTGIPMHSYFAALGHDPASALVADVLCDWVRDHAECSALPVLAAVAPAKSGGRAGPGYFTDIPAGPLLRRHIADLYIYPNRVRALQITGVELLDWLDMSAGWFNQFETGTTGKLLTNPSRAGHNFDVLHGVSWEIDLSIPPRFDDAGNKLGNGESRIRNLKCQDRPVSSDQQFIVVTNSYREMGGGSFPVSKAPRPLLIPDALVSDILLTRLSGLLLNGFQQAGSVWKFCPQEDTSAVLRSGPGARAHLSELSNRVAGDIQLAPGGFLDIPIKL